MDRSLHGVCTIYWGLLFILNDYENTRLVVFTRDVSKPERSYSKSWLDRP